MYGEAVSLATNWMNRNSANSCISSLKKLRIKQGWFADFDWATSSSIFFCTVPDGSLCNFNGTAVSQYETGELPLAVDESQHQFSKMLQDKNVVRAASFISSVAMGGDGKLVIKVLMDRERRFRFAVKHYSAASFGFSELVKMDGLIPEKLKSLVEKQDGIGEFDGAASIVVDDCGEAYELRRKLLGAFSGDVSLEYGLELSESEVLDLSKIGKPELGFDVSDATPTNRFIEWFHGESDDVPEGRSLICNIPLKRSQEGNVVCVHLDNFKNECRLVLCTSVANVNEMRKLATNKLGEFGFGEYTPLKQ